MVDRLAAYWDRHHLTDEESEQMYVEGCEWYRRYGMTGSVVPPNRASFEREVERYCREVLTPNPASDYLIEFINRRSIPDMSASPDYPTHPRLRPLADALLPTVPVRMALAPPMRLVIFGGLPAYVRDRFGIRWTRGDDRRYRAIRAGIRATWSGLPASFKWYPAARKGWLRERGQVPRRF
jgi:uncharacterized protein (DUF2236 family)